MGFDSPPRMPQQVDVISRAKSQLSHTSASGPLGVFWLPLLRRLCICDTIGPSIMKVSVGATVVAGKGKTVADGGVRYWIKPPGPSRSTAQSETPPRLRPWYHWMREDLVLSDTQANHSTSS